MASRTSLSRLTLLAGAGIASAALVVGLPPAALAASPVVVAKPSPSAPTPTGAKKTAPAAKKAAPSAAPVAKKAAAPVAKKAAPAAASMSPELIRATIPINPAVGTLMSAARNISAGTAPATKKPAPVATTPAKGSTESQPSSPVLRVGELGKLDPASPFGRKLVELGALPKRAPTPVPPVTPAQQSAATLDGLRWLSPEQKLQSMMAATTRLGQDASPALKATEKKLLTEAKDRARANQNAGAVTALTTLARAQAPTPAQGKALANFVSDVSAQAKRTTSTASERSASAVAGQRAAVAGNAGRDRRHQQGGRHNRAQGPRRRTGGATGGAEGRRAVR